MKSLRGWTRIGIVLSVIWGLIILSFAVIEYREMASERTHNLTLPAPPKGFVIDPDAQTFFYRWQPIDLLAKDSVAYVRDFKLNTFLFVSVLSGPVIGTWGIVYFIVFVFRWVKKGFTATTRNS